MPTTSQRSVKNFPTPKKKKASSKKAARPEPPPVVLLQQTIPKADYEALVAMRKSIGLSTDQEMVRVLIKSGLKQNGFLPQD